MCEYTIYVTYKGKQYQTNVLADKNKSQEEIYRIGKEQVLRQWAINY
ncbi:BA3454 family stress response protein [Bacillus sp. USDA818B3_A]|nr:BA3454 family stress response protein [Bacillus sp. USDA818B3_A]